MKWRKAILLATLISGCSLTIGFAEMQAFIQSEKALVREDNDLTSDVIMELKKGDRVEVVNALASLEISPFGKLGYVDFNEIELYELTKSGEVTLSEDIRITSEKGVETLPSGTVLSIYDYTNEHYMIKWDGFYYFVHDTFVKTKFKGSIVKPRSITEDTKKELMLVNSGLADLFDGMDNTLGTYQTTKLAEIESSINSLISDENKEENTSTDNEKVVFGFKSGDFDLENYLDNPIIKAAASELEKPYVWGAIGPNSYDCSGFTYYVYKSLGITIPRVSANQGDGGTLVDVADLKPGDLVFFDTRAANNLQDITDNPDELSSSSGNSTGTSKFIPTTVTHVGIYIGEGFFIHASSGQKKVVVQDMNISYYQNRYLWAKRYE